MNKKLLFPLAGSLLLVAGVQFLNSENNESLKEATKSSVASTFNEESVGGLTPIVNVVEKPGEEVSVEAIVSVSSTPFVDEVKPSKRKGRIAPKASEIVLFSSSPSVLSEIEPITTIADQFSGIQVFVQDRDTKEIKRVAAIQDPFVQDELPMPVVQELQPVASIDEEFNIYNEREIIEVTAEDIEEMESGQYTEIALEVLAEEENVINDWADLDLETVKWKEVKNVFVPEDLKHTTVLIEVYTLEQHQKDFQKKIKNYYQQHNIDLTNAVIKKGQPQFIERQEKEVSKIIKGAKTKMIAVNVDEIDSYDVKEYKYILRKIVSVQDVDPSTGSGEAHIQYYFYDRLENEEYPKINSNYLWLSKHLK